MTLVSFSLVRASKELLKTELLRSGNHQQLEKSIER